MAIQSSSEFMNPNYKEEAPDQQDVAQAPLKEEVAAPKDIEEQSLEQEVAEQPQESKEAPVVKEAVEDTSDSDEAMTPEAKNFVTLRELKRKAERERDELLAQINASKHQQSKQRFDDDEEFNFNDDDLIEGKHLKKIVNKLNKVNAQLGQYQSQANMSLTESKIKKRYNDFDDVVTQENLQILAAREPEIAQSLNANPDLYSKALTAYTMIKDLQIYVPPKAKKRIANIVKESRKIDENLSMPKVAASISPQTGDSALSKASDYSDDLSSDEAARVYSEMLKRSSF